MPHTRLNRLIDAKYYKVSERIINMVNIKPFPHMSLHVCLNRLIDAKYYKGMNTIKNWNDLSNYGVSIVSSTQSITKGNNTSHSSYRKRLSSQSSHRRKVLQRLLIKNLVYQSSVICLNRLIDAKYYKGASRKTGPRRACLWRLNRLIDAKYYKAGTSPLVPFWKIKSQSSHRRKVLQRHQTKGDLRWNIKCLNRLIDAKYYKVHWITFETVLSKLRSQSSHRRKVLQRPSVLTKDCQ